MFIINLKLTRQTAFIFFALIKPFNIPWKCLDLEPKPQKTFAQAVLNICEIQVSLLPQGVIKGDFSCDSDSDFKWVCSNSLFGLTFLKNRKCNHNYILYYL